MAQAASDSWIDRLQRYISGQDSSLANLSPNLFPSSPTKVKSLSPLAKAHEIINTPTDHCNSELASLAFKVVYLKLRSECELLQTIKKHQRYIVQLSTKQLYTTSRHELSTLASVLVGSKTFDLMSWSDLLKTKCAINSLPNAIVVSFYFFVVQGVLQEVSSNLYTFDKNRLCINAGVLWDVAKAFLSDSAFITTLRQGDPQQQEKYLKNKIKMLSGFLKITKFLISKQSNISLQDCHNAFEIKLNEARIEQRDMAGEMQIERYSSSSMMKLFILDYKETLKGSVVVVAVDTQYNETKLNNEALRSSVTKKPPKLIISSQEYDDGVITVHKKCLSQGTIRPEDLSEIISYLKTNKRDKATFEKKLQVLGPLIEKIVGTADALDKVPQLARVCFEFANSTSSITGFQYATLLDIASFPLTKNSRDLNRVSKRIEFSIWTILDLQEYNLAEALVRAYLNQAVDKYIDASFSRMAAELVVQNFQLTVLFFGQALRLNTSEQVKLFGFIIPLLAKRLPLDSREVVQKIFTVLADELPLSTVFEMLCSFRIDVDISKRIAKENIDNLFLAAINTQNLFSKSALVSDLIAIQLLALKWLKDSNCALDEGDSTFLHIVRGLYQNAFYDLSLSLVESYFRRNTQAEPEITYALRNVQCDCSLKTSSTNLIPTLLSSAGECLKKMGEPNRKGVSAIDVMRWKLLQLEYFLITNDQHKLESKVIETGEFMASKEEFQLNAEVSAVSLRDRLTSVLILSKYQLFVSKLQFNEKRFVLAIEHIKLSLKLIKSALRKSECLDEFSIHESRRLLGQCLKAAYAVHRHVGLAKEAALFLSEWSKINLMECSPVVSTYGHFDLVPSFEYIGQHEVAAEEFSKGLATAQYTPFKLILLCQKISASIFEENNEKSLRELNFEAENILKGESTDIFQALSIKEVEELFFLFQFSKPSRAMTDSVVFSDIAKSNRHAMLLKALTVLCYELKSILGVFKVNVLNDVDISRFQCDPNLWDKLVECRNCILRMTEEEYYICFDQCQQKVLGHLFRACVMTLSPVSGIEISMLSLVDQLVYLEDTPKTSNQLYKCKLLEAAAPVPLFGPSSTPSLATHSYVGLFNEIQEEMPLNWAAVSQDICSLTGDLLITKICPGNSLPLVINIPMSRSPRGLSFKQMIRNLKEIIKQSNLSTKSSVTSLVKTKEDRKNWWRHRFNLDLQLQDLLNDLESTISGLKGIFSTTDAMSSQFQKFSQTLGTAWKQAFKGLPFDFDLGENLCGLFFNLDPFDENKTFCPKNLEDLVMFTVDLLGRKYSLDCKPQKVARLMELLKPLYLTPMKGNENEHLILVTSDACSLIPWESIGFLRGKSVTRMPSFRCLKELLRRFNGDFRVCTSDAFKISYVLNPGRDLKRTQSRFEPILTKLVGATGICGEAPEEENIAALIRGSDLYIFMGHGGGEQYVRLSSVLNNTQTRESLPLALLMGCSSCAFQENGKLPTTSNISDWLAHGSPTVVANLWDVTDKDIDLFTMSMLEKWGVIDNSRRRDLSDAVRTGREKCILKYLNGAAPVVYGLPLFYR